MENEIAFPLTSPTISVICKALSLTQGQMSFAKKDTENEFFKKPYADLASCWEACRKPLSDNGLSVSQVQDENFLITILMHESGEWIRSRTKISMSEGKNAMQAYGSALTYARRYALSAIVGISQDDDDANSAGDSSTSGKKPIPQQKPPATQQGQPPPSSQPVGSTTTQGQQQPTHTKKDTRTPEEIKTKFDAYIQKKQTDFGASEVETVLEKFRNDNGEFNPEKFTTIAEALEKKFPTVKGAAK
jgi:hypothetical protein